VVAADIPVDRTDEGTVEGTNAVTTEGPTERTAEETAERVAVERLHGRDGVSMRETI
jgi:hypothetical protein